MARPLRIEYEGAVYHVAARGNERGKIFFSKKDYEKFKEYIKDRFVSVDSDHAFSITISSAASAFSGAPNLP